MTLNQDDDQGINNHSRYSKMNVVQLVKAPEGKLRYLGASGFDSDMQQIFYSYIRRSSKPANQHRVFILTVKGFLKYKYFFEIIL